LLRERLVGNIFVDIFVFDQPVEGSKILKSSNLQTESGFEFGIWKVCEHSITSEFFPFCSTSAM